MDLNLEGTKHFEAPPTFHLQQEATLEGNTSFYRRGTDNPFLDAFHHPLCKLNLQETSDLVKSLPVSSNGAESSCLLDISGPRRRELGLTSLSRRTVEAPPTPGRPVFSFSVGNLPRKGFPSKWEDAEKWLVSGSSCHDSPAHHHGLRPPLEYCPKISKQCNEFRPQHAARAFTQGSASTADVFLKDKFANEADYLFRTFKCSEPTKEGFLFRNAAENPMKDSATESVSEVKHRDMGTEMTPLASCTTSRCHTPFKSTSPARHNTPANRSGPLVLSNSSSTTTIDITQIQERHFAKLQCGILQFDSITSNWSSREEEEEEISKSLRHFELNNEYKKCISESRTCAREEEEKTRCCLGYQREEAKIQAWVNLQKAKAEAKSRKLEVKIEKMRSKLEEKLMKRMAIVHRKAEEWRTVSRIQHSEQIQRANDELNARKMITITNPNPNPNRESSYLTRSSNHHCGCFPCTTKI